MKAIWVLYRTLMRAIDSRARRYGFLVLGLVGVVVAWAVSRDLFFEPSHDTVQLLRIYNLKILAPVAALVYGTAALGDAMDDGTLVYLWLRPVARWKLVVAGFLSAVTFALPASVLPAVIESMITSGARRMLFAAAVSSAVAAIAYSAAFVLLGLVSRRSLVWGIGYLLIFENFIANGGKSLAALSIQAHSVSVLAKMTGERIRLDHFASVTGIVTCLGIAAVAMVVTSWRLVKAEVP